MFYLWQHDETIYCLTGDGCPKTSLKVIRKISNQKFPTFQKDDLILASKLFDRGKMLLITDNEDEIIGYLALIALEE